MRPGRESNPKKQFKVCRFNRLNYRGCCSSFRAVMPEFEEYEALFWTNITKFPTISRCQNMLRDRLVGIREPNRVCPPGASTYKVMRSCGRCRI